jgi:hypothetical protein
MQGKWVFAYHWQTRITCRKERKWSKRKLPVTSKKEVRSSVEEKDEVRDRTILGEYRIPRSSLREEVRKNTRVP